MLNPDLLIKTAELLEKTAAHIEESEAAAHRIIAEHQDTEAKKIASQLSALAGSPVDHKTVSKMAGMGQDVVDILHKLASADAVDSMGGPETQEKTASVAGMPAEDARFINFLSTH